MEIDVRQQKLIDIESIPKQALASDLPDEFVGTVEEIVRVQTGYGPSLKFTIVTEDNKKTVTTYRIPKMLTGKGQLDQLIAQLKKMKIKQIADMKGKKFRWRRMELPGSVKGNARHYPIEVVK